MTSTPPRVAAPFDPRELGAQCHLCLLGPKGKCKKGAWMPVPNEHRESSVVAVAQMPGPAEVAHGYPFADENGKHWKGALADLGIQRPQVAIINEQHCPWPGAPSGARKRQTAEVKKQRKAAEKAEYSRQRARGVAAKAAKAAAKAHAKKTILAPQEACRPAFLKQLLRYPYVIALGAAASKAAANMTGGIDAVRGDMLEVRRSATEWALGGVDLAQWPRRDADGHPVQLVVPTFHPAYIARAPGARDRWVSDLGKSFRFFNDALTWHTPSAIYQPTPEQFEWIMAGWWPPHVEGAAFGDSPPDTSVGQAHLGEDFDVAIPHVTTWRRFRHAAPFQVIDYETDGIEPTTCQIRCVGLATPDLDSAGRPALPGAPFEWLSRAVGIHFEKCAGGTGGLREDPDAAPGRYYSAENEAAIKDILRKYHLDPSHVWVGHNGITYDAEVSKNFLGVYPVELLDTLGHARAVNPEMRKGLKSITTHYTDARHWETSETGENAATSTKVTDFFRLDYCVYARELVTLSDGTKRPISQLVAQKYAGEVKAVDAATGAVVDARVVGWHRNRVKGQSWVSVQTTQTPRNGKGVVVTPDHRIMVQTEEGIVERPAADLRAGDLILLSALQLPRQVRQAVLGTMMGDSSLKKPPSRRGSPGGSAYMDGSHVHACGLTAEKIQWMGGFFIDGGVAAGGQGMHKGVAIKGRDRHSYRTVVHPDFAPLYDARWVDGAPYIDQRVLQEMSALAWAWWYMDDGCLQTGGPSNNTAILYTQRYPKESVERLRGFLRDRFGPTHLCADKSVRLGRPASRGFLAWIAPHILPSMRYKLPTEIDNAHPFEGWPTHEWSRATTAKVISVLPYHPAQGRSTPPARYLQETRFCLTVEGQHNFFAGGILVANCARGDCTGNARVAPIVYSIAAKRGYTAPLRADLRPSDWGNRPWTLEEVDRETGYMCRELHINGQPVDPVIVQRETKRYQAKVKRLRQTLQQTAAALGYNDIDLDSDEQEMGDGEVINPGAYGQVRELIYETCGRGCPPGMETRDFYTDTGLPGTGDIVLRAHLADPTTPTLLKKFIWNLRLERRYKNKYLATILQRAVPRRASPKKGMVWDDGRIHASFSPWMAAPGRLACRNPNLQNQIKLLKIIYRIGKDKWGRTRYFLQCDFDQIHLRVIANYWRIKALIDGFVNGKEAHGQLANVMYSGGYILADDWGRRGAPPSHDQILAGWKPIGGVALGQRNKAKTFRYARAYKAIAETILMVMQSTEVPKMGADGKVMLDSLGIPIMELPNIGMNLRDDVKPMIERHNAAEPDWDRAWQEMQDLYAAQGYMADPLFGRRSGMLSGGKAQEVVNFPVLACESAVMRLAEWSVRRAFPFQKHGPGTGLISQVHDEVTVEWVGGRLERLSDGDKYQLQMKRPLGDGFVASNKSYKWCSEIEDNRRLLEHAMTVKIPGWDIPFTAEAGVGLDLKES